MSLIDEIKRRNVHRVAIAYLASAWLIIQILETLLPIFGVPETSIRWAVIALAIGFVPALMLAWVFEITTAGIQRDEDVRRDATNASISGKTLDRVIILVLTLAVAYFAVDKFLLEAGPSTALGNSVAVMPFDNLSSDPEQVFLAVGIAEDISTLLGKIEDLRVVSRSSTESMQGQGLPLGEISRRLNVAHILRGSVRRYGNQLRITAELIEGESGTQVWSDVYDRELEDVFDIQDQISSMVVATLEVKILGESPRVDRIDSEAYGLYLRGRYINHTGRYDQLPLAEELLLRSLEIEPDYVLAMSALGRVYLSMPTDYFASAERKKAKVREIAARVAEIAPTSPKALGWASWIAYSWDGDLPTAARLMEQALAVDPRNISTLRPSVPLLLVLGQTEDALAVAKYVVARDPGCINCLFNLSAAYRALGKLDEAEESLRDAVEWAPDRHGIHLALATVLLQNGKPAEALVALEHDQKPGAGASDRIMALHDLGREEEFDAALAKYPVDHPVPDVFTARIYAWIGENDKALALLDQLAERDGPRVLTDLGDGYYKRLEGDPRFVELLKKHGAINTANSIPGVHLKLPMNYE